MNIYGVGDIGGRGKHRLYGKKPEQKNQPIEVRARKEARVELSVLKVGKVLLSDSLLSLITKARAAKPLFFCSLLGVRSREAGKLGPFSPLLFSSLLRNSRNFLSVNYTFSLCYCACSWIPVSSL